MLKIYHFPGTRGFRVIWVCEELSVPYEIVPVNFAAEYRASPEWRALNPVGKVPVMTDGDMTMFESCAMMQYVLDRYGDGRLQPAKDDPTYAHYLQWCWFAEATFARPLGEIVNHRREFKPELDDVVAEMKGRATACVAALDAALSDRDYLLGDTLSAADLSICYVMRGYRRMVSESLPACVQTYLDRVTALPSYKATVKADSETGERLKDENED
jgi:glutathione S-transferase